MTISIQSIYDQSKTPKDMYQLLKAKGFDDNQAVSLTASWYQIFQQTVIGQLN